MFLHASMTSFNLQSEAHLRQAFPHFADRELRSRETSVLPKVIHLGCHKSEARHYTP